MLLQKVLEILGIRYIAINMQNSKNNFEIKLTNAYYQIDIDKYRLSETSANKNTRNTLKSVSNLFCDNTKMHIPLVLIEKPR